MKQLNSSSNKAIGACRQHYESSLTQSLYCETVITIVWIALFSLRVALFEPLTRAEPCVAGVEVQLLQTTKAEMLASTNVLVLKRFQKSNRLDYGTQKSVITHDDQESAIELFHSEKVYVRSPNQAVAKNAFTGTNTLWKLDGDARELVWTNQMETGAVTLIDPRNVSNIVNLEADLPHFPLANRLQIPSTIIGKEMVIQSRVSKPVDLDSGVSGRQGLIVTMELNFLSATNKAFEKSQFEVPKDYKEVQVAPDDPVNARPLPPPAGIISKEQMESRINEIRMGAPVLRATGAIEDLSNKP